MNAQAARVSTKSESDIKIFEDQTSKYCRLAAEKGVDETQFKRLLELFGRFNQPNQVQEFKDSFRPVGSPSKILRILDPLTNLAEPIRLTQK